MAKKSRAKRAKKAKKAKKRNKKHAAERKAPKPAKKKRAGRAPKKSAKKAKKRGKKGARRRLLAPAAVRRHPAQIEELLAFAAEIRLLFHALRRQSDRVHAELGLTAGERSLLESLRDTGPRTVPQMARTAGVSRQHVQSVVNPLVGRGLLELRPNPKHKRSPLCVLSSEGEERIVRAHREEQALLRTSRIPLDEPELRRLVRDLVAMRTWACAEDELAAAAAAGETSTESGAKREQSRRKTS